MRKKTATEKDGNSDFKPFDTGNLVSLVAHRRTHHLSDEATELLESIAESMEEEFEAICDEVERLDTHAE
ncbi:hypothetical protein [Haladaptatus halobius]|jgi:hypothetical protein|uniref:hypothetical protein n=1 Tax=Haladaptatus halobius TaxID=2884875 RepID=UPI001D0AF35C|nr:hypothetical protein [Haladaptatus halobius]